MKSYDFVGIDIAKDKFDAWCCMAKKSHRVFDNNPAGHRLFIRWIRKHTNQPWVCLEATGFYSQGVAEALAAEGITTSVVNPYKVKHYSKSLLLRNKNDKLDAKLLAQFCETMQPRHFVPRSKAQQRLRGLLQLLEAQKKHVQRLENQHDSLAALGAKKEVNHILKLQKAIIAKQEKQLDQCVKDDDKFARMFEIITSIKGVGPQTAYKMIAYLPDIHLFSSAKQVAAYLGLSPEQNQSGKFAGKARLSKFGCRELRRAFYFPAINMKRFNEDLQPFVGRLEKAGKCNMVIIGALMRKLAHLLYGMLKNDKHFDPKMLREESKKEPLSTNPQAC